MLNEECMGALTAALNGNQRMASHDSRQQIVEDHANDRPGAPEAEHIYQGRLHWLQTTRDLVLARLLALNAMRAAGEPDPVDAEALASRLIAEGVEGEAAWERALVATDGGLSEAAE